MLEDATNEFDLVYRFYTYDTKGNDIEVDIRATSHSQAWQLFRKQYGQRLIDDVKQYQ